MYAYNTGATEPTIPTIDKAIRNNHSHNIIILAIVVVADVVIIAAIMIITIIIVVLRYDHSVLDLQKNNK